MLLKTSEAVAMTTSVQGQSYTIAAYARSHKVSHGTNLYILSNSKGTFVLRSP